MQIALDRVGTRDHAQFAAPRGLVFCEIKDRATGRAGAEASEVDGAVGARERQGAVGGAEIEAECSGHGER